MMSKTDAELVASDVRLKAQALAAEFQSAKPFRHVVIDDFLELWVAEALLQQFPSAKDPSKLLNEFGVPNPKSAVADVRSIGGTFIELDNYIQTPGFLSLMSTITGIPDLQYDPWYYGAGTHENFHGAGLDPHYDFNIHPRTGHHRRINAIVYLNKDWDTAWGGSICFHSDPYDLRGDQVTEVRPEFNRCVVFETTERSWHSVPPVNLPPEERHRSRKSFTIYLYSETRPPEEIAAKHATVYVQRNLPEHIRAGRLLTDEDIKEICANIERRNVYLKTLYKREYQFSEHISHLQSQIRTLEGASYVPLLGYAKVERVTAPLFADRFLGTRLAFSALALSPFRP